MTELPLPKSLKALIRFLGMVGWYRKFVNNFAAVSAPLEMLSSAPVLRSPDFSQPFYIHCDGGKTGVGGVLVQQSENGDEFPIALVSQKLNTAQKNYSVTEQECLAAIICVTRFRAYVEGHELTIVTDHSSRERRVLGQLAY